MSAMEGPVRGLCCPPPPATPTHASPSGRPEICSERGGGGAFEPQEGGGRGGVQKVGSQVQEPILFGFTLC